MKKKYSNSHDPKPVPAKKKYSTPDFPENTLAKVDFRKLIYDFLKENLTIDVDVYESWGYYENGPSVTVKLCLNNPETGESELISSSTGNA